MKLCSNKPRIEALSVLQARRGLCERGCTDDDRGGDAGDGSMNVVDPSLLAGGACIVVTSSYSRKTVKYYLVVPFNQGTFAGIPGNGRERSESAH